MKGNGGKSNISKVGVFKIKNRLHVSISQNCTAKFHIWRGLKWHRGLILVLSKWMNHIHSRLPWVAAVFWTSAIWCAKSSSYRTPCVNVHQGKNESSPNQADTATVRLAKAVEMGTQQICQKHQGWAEVMRQNLTQTKHDGLPIWLTWELMPFSGPSLLTYFSIWNGFIQLLNLPMIFVLIILSWKPLGSLLHFMWLLWLCFISILIRLALVWANSYTKVWTDFSGIIRVNRAVHRQLSPAISIIKPWGLANMVSAGLWSAVLQHHGLDWPSS